MSLSKQILIKLKADYPKWINGGEIERYADDMGYKASNASRRCRELENEGSIEKSYSDGCVIYRAKHFHSLKIPNGVKPLNYGQPKQQVLI